MMEQQQEQEQDEDQDKNNNHSFGNNNIKYYNDVNVTRLRSNSSGSLGDRSNWDAEEGKYNLI